MFVEHVSPSSSSSLVPKEAAVRASRAAVLQQLVILTSEHHPMSSPIGDIDLRTPSYELSFLFASQLCPRLMSGVPAWLLLLLALCYDS